MKRAFMAMVMLAIVNLAFSQEDTIRKTIDEVVISANKFEMLRKDVVQRIDVVTNRELRWMNPMNTADLLTNTGNVLVQKSQGGGGSPVIRGFEANKVLIMVDGVRLNNAIFRGGHLQNVLRIDNSILDKVEILYGPSSVMYGSDALGGVMHFITRNPVLGEKSGGNAMVRYSSATGEKTGHVDLNIGGSKIASLTSLTGSDYGDIVQGSHRTSAYPTFGERPFYVSRIGGTDSVFANPDPDRQVGTAYRQYDLLQKVLYQPDDRTSHLLNFQLSNTGNVNRYDRLTEADASGTPKYAEWYYGPEFRLMTSYRFRKTLNAKMMDKFSVLAAWQLNRESRNSRKLHSSSLKSQNERVGIVSIDADAYKKLSRHEINYGVEAYLDDVRSTACISNINTSDRTPADTRYPDGKNTMNTFAAYAQDKFSLIPGQLFLNAGLRYNYSVLESTFTEQSLFAFPFDNAEQKSGAFSGTAGLLWMPGSNTRLTLNVSTGFRTPNIDDLSKVFDSSPGTLIIPNPRLKPEYSTNFEVGFGHSFGNKGRVEGGIFYTLLDNAIVVDEASFGGLDSVLYDGVMSKVYSSQNKGQAFVTGAWFSAGVDLGRGFSASGTVNYTYGRIVAETGNTPLDHIPPVFGKASVEYRKNRIHSEFYVLFNGKKDISDYLLNAEDNEKYATPDGMPAWYTLNIRLAWRFTDRLNVQVACENILDRNYRVFASGVSAPGRNFRATLRFAF
jgi:hemoglobin/transferrin/lactoferrin receptor protein